MLTVSIDYKDKVISHIGPTFSTVKKAEWFTDPFVQRVLKTIDKASVIQGFCIEDRWGNTVPPEYMSNGTKAIILMKYFTEAPVYGTRCGDNCIPFIEEIANEKDIHIVLHHCMPFSEGFKFYVTDVQREVISFRDWMEVFYATADAMAEADD